MTANWMLQGKNRQSNETGRSDWRVAESIGPHPKLTMLFALIGFIAVAIAVLDSMLTSSAFAKSRASQSSQGNGNHGLGRDGANLPAAGAPDNTWAERPDTASTKGPAYGAVSDTKVDVDLPVDKKLDIGGNHEDFSGYLEHIDYPGKIPAEAEGADAKGKAVGLRRKEDLDTDAFSAKGNGSRFNRLAIEPRSYSQHEVLAINLSSVAVAHLRRLGFSRDASTWIGGDTVTVFSVPSGMDALTAIDRLEAELPNEQFHLDHLYRLYQPAMKDDADKDQRTKPASVNGAKKCLDDRCYPRALIRWSDDLATCASGVRIGIIDTDVDLRHPTFRGQNITHKSFHPALRSPSSNWHGTGVLALLAGRPDSGTPGLINQAQFYVASIFFAGEDGQPVTNTVSLLQALDWMKTSGVTLVNLSLTGMDDALVQKRIASLAREGLVFTAAAGNGGPAAEPSYPAAYPQVISVTAISKHRQIFPFANHGAYIDLAAPGVDVWTAVPDSREGYRSGTSFAVPFATALLAIQQQSVRRLPKVQLLDYVETITVGAPGTGSIYGRGLVQAPPECPVTAITATRQMPVWGVATR